MALLIGGVAIAGMAATAGCSNDKQSRNPEAPSRVPVTPTEKAAPTTLTPGGPNSFSPTILAPPAPTALPGNVITG